MGVTLKQRNGLEKDELELQLYGFVAGYISTLAPLDLSDIKIDKSVRSFLLFILRQTF